MIASGGEKQGKTSENPDQMTMTSATAQSVKCIEVKYVSVDSLMFGRSPNYAPRVTGLRAVRKRWIR